MTMHHRTIPLAVAAICITAGPVLAQVVPPVTGRTFTLPTSANHKLFIPDTLTLTGVTAGPVVHANEPVDATVGLQTSQPFPCPCEAIS